jgi:glycosyltransferase involved in cell wall biosynthesis
MRDRVAEMCVLMVYVEPTPYVIALVRALSERLPGRVRVCFLGANLSQDWNLDLSGIDAIVLSGGHARRLVRLLGIVIGPRYRLLHLAGWSPWALAMAALAGRCLGKRVGMESDSPLRAQPRWKAFLKGVLYPLLFRLPNMLFPGGTRQAQYLKHYGVPEARMRIARMTVDVDYIRASCAAADPQARQQARRSLDIGRDEVTFLFVGRLSPEKGLHTLLVAFERLLAEQPAAKLLVVGDGSQREQVEAACLRTSAMKYLGRRDFHGVIDAYRVSDVLVLPSIFEPWGLVVNEAMAAGLAVVAADSVGCVDDLVQHGSTGLVFRAGDVEDLAAALRRMVRNPAERRAMAQRGQALIATWTIEGEAAEIEAGWLRMAGGPG